MAPPTDEPAGSENLGLNAFRRVPATAGLALDELSAALSGMLDSGADPYGEQPSQPIVISAAELIGAATTRTVANPDDMVAGSAAAVDEADDACELSPRSILEALLFVGSPNNEPLSSKQVAGLMRGVRPAEIDALVLELNADYESRRCPYRIDTEAAGYRLVLRDEFAAVRDQFQGKARQARLSQAAIEVLAAVAYHAPITADEVSRLRGTPSGQVLTQLVRRELVRLERSTKPKRVQYYTTPRFLQLFGLESLEDLPRSPDLEQK